MNKLIACSSFLILFLTCSAWADENEKYWWGHTYYNGQPIKEVLVFSFPAGGVDTSHSASAFYQLSPGNGMEEGEYYESIYAEIFIDGEWKYGTYYANDTFHIDVEKGPMNIYLTGGPRPWSQ
jgi:hypothetical protein